MRGPPHPRCTRSSILSIPVGVVNPLASQLHHPVCSGSSFPLPFFLSRRFLSFALNLPVELWCASGSSAKLIRLGVEGTELAGVRGVAVPDLSTLCRGGDLGRVVEEWVPLVNNRDMDAVAVDVEASGMGIGVIGNRLVSMTDGGGGGGWSLRIRRRLLTVIRAWTPSEESDDWDTSSIVGTVMGLGVCERERSVLVDGARRGVWPPLRSVLVLELRRDKFDGPAALLTKEESIVYARADEGGGGGGDGVAG